MSVYLEFLRKQKLFVSRAMLYMKGKKSQYIHRPKENVKPQASLIRDAPPMHLHELHGVWGSMRAGANDLRDRLPTPPGTLVQNFRVFLVTAREAMCRCSVIPGGKISG